MKDFELAVYIQNVGGVTPSIAAEHMGTSVRTVRERVRRANAAMDGFARIELKRGDCYSLAVFDQARYDAWLASRAAAQGGSLPDTPKERVRYLLFKLLLANGWATLDELAEAACVSRRVVQGDMGQIDGYLSSHGLALERQPRKGMRATGPELSRRAALADLSAQAIGAGPKDALARGGSTPFWGVAKEVVRQALQTSGFVLNPAAFTSFVVHLTVAVLRVRDGFALPEGSLPEPGPDEAGCAEVAQLMADVLAERTGVALPPQELDYLALHLAGKRMLSEASPKGDAASQPDSLALTDESWDVADEMVERVQSAFGIDFKGDLELRMNLARHVGPLQVRLRHGMALRNPLLDDIKENYPLAFSMGREASVSLSLRFGGSPSDDEVGYIALAFALALERKRGERPKKTLLLVCSSGRVGARLLEQHCRREFGDYIGEVLCCEAHEVASQDFTNIDYVFTTVPLDVAAVPVPVRTVSNFLGTDEACHVRAFLEQDAGAAALDVARYFDPDLFFTHLAFSTKREVIGFMVREVRKRRPLPDDFERLVWEREDAVATSFGNGVAMPHPSRAVAGETFVAVGLLDEPVEWSERGDLVRAVFLSVFSSDAGLELQSFYSAFADVLISKKAVKKLLEYQDWNVFLNLVEASASAESRRKRL